MSKNESEITNHQPKTKSHFWRNLFLILLMLILLAVIAAGVYSFIYFKKNNAHVVNQINTIKNQKNDQEQRFARIESNLDAVANSAQKTENLAAQHEKVIAELQSGNYNKWYVGYAEYLVNLANTEAQFNYQYQKALAILARARDVLQNVSDPALQNIRQAIDANILTLQSQNIVDINMIYTRLAAIAAQINTLPLQQILLNPAQNTKAVSVDPNASWWQKGLDETWQNLEKVVIVHKNVDDKLPFILPDQRSYLLQNLHIKLQTAMYAALTHNQIVYAQSLAAINEWLTQYFDKNNPQTKAVLNNINELQKLNVAPANVNFAETIKLFQTNVNTNSATMQ